MWDRGEIKAQGKIALKANYWRSVLSAFLITILAGGSALSSGFSGSGSNTDPGTDESMNALTEGLNSMPDEQKMLMGAGLAAAFSVIGIVALLLKIFVFNPLQVGCYGFFRENAGGRPVTLGVLASGFGDYGHTFVTLFLRDIFLILWTCLFIVPGIIKVYSYRMVPFILRDHPEMSATEVITASRRMMDGNKWNTFVFDLSYIGWYLLGFITCGLVNVFWTEPYRQNANAALYLTLTGDNRLGQDYVYVAEPQDEIIPR